MTSKAAKRRAKKARITLPGGAEVTQRAKHDPRREPAQDARMVVWEARCRQEGIPVTKETLRDVDDPMRGHEIGQCILDMNAGRKASREMWEIFLRAGAARWRYRILKIGQAANPQNAALPVIPEVFEVHGSLQADYRTAEERASAAVRANDEWLRHLNMIRIPQLRMALANAVDGFVGPWWSDGKATQGGRWAAMALKTIWEAQKQ